MAQKIELISGSAFIGNPIMVRVTASVVTNTSVLHKVRLHVSAALSSDNEWKDFSFSSLVDNGGTADFDISDALRCLVAGFQYTVVRASTTYPFIRYKLKAWDDYLDRGILSEGVNEVSYPSELYGLIGSFTDLERYMGASSTLPVTSFSRKPKGEVYAPYGVFVYPEPLETPIGINSVVNAGPTCSVLDLSGKEGEISVGGRNIWVDKNAKDRFLFQFVNGFGVVESASAEMREDVETSGGSETFARGVSSAFNDVNRSIIRKDPRFATVGASTGYITKEWAEWWHNEFLSSDKIRENLFESCWILWGDKWLPCTVVASDSAVIYNKTKGDLVSIDFDIRFPFPGLPPLS